MTLLRRALLATVLGGLLAVAPPAVAAPVLGASTCFGMPATIIGTDNPEIIDGTSGDDVIVAGDGNDTIDGNGGNDRICAGNGDGQRSSDQFDDDIVEGGNGDDEINGGFGNDTIDGEGGGDTLLGDDGVEPPGETSFLSTTDRISGGGGDDVLVGAGDQDILRGEDGNDRIESRDGSEGTPTGAGGTGSLLVPGGFNVDVVIGGTGTDVCNADEEDDVSECEEKGDEGDEVEFTDNLVSGDPLDPNNSFGSAVSARRPSSSDSSGGGGSSSGGSTRDPSALSPSFFSLLGSVSRRCLPSAPAVTRRGISFFRIGERAYRSVLRPLVVPIDFFPPLAAPLFATRGRITYCNDGGGRTYVLSARRKVRLVATTADSRRTRGIGAGDRLSSLRRAYPGTRRISGGLYRASRSSSVVFGVRNGRVRFVAVASRGLLADPAALQRAVRRLGVGR